MHEETSKLQVRSFKVISADDPKQIQRLYRKNRKKTLRIIHEESDFCDLDPEVIIDVTVPFDNGMEAFDAARNEKVTKYNSLAQELSLRGKNVVVEAVVVVALGSWDPANDRLMKRICSRKYLKLFKRIEVSEAIIYSRDIYEEHTRWFPQNSGGRQVRGPLTH